jgi:hypothetical protein
MKKMQPKIVTAKTQKHERRDQIEPLQEQVAEVLTQSEVVKKEIAQTQIECA